MRFIPTTIHGVLDYVVGLLLAASPWLFGFDYGGAETWVPVVLGLGALVYSVLTNYELGLIRRIPMPTHLMLDLTSGLLLVVSPWLFGFADEVWIPHTVIGLLEVGVSLMTERAPRHEGTAGWGTA